MFDETLNAIKYSAIAKQVGVFYLFIYFNPVIIHNTQ